MVEKTDGTYCRTSSNAPAKVTAKLKERKEREEREVEFIQLSTRCPHRFCQLLYQVIGNACHLTCLPKPKELQIAKKHVLGNQVLVAKGCESFAKTWKMELAHHRDVSDPIFLPQFIGTNPDKTQCLYTLRSSMPKQHYIFFTKKFRAGEKKPRKTKHALTYKTHCLTETLGTKPVSSCNFKLQK